MCWFYDILVSVQKLTPQRETDGQQLSQNMFTEFQSKKIGIKTSVLIFNFLLKLEAVKLSASYAA